MNVGCLEKGARELSALTLFCNSDLGQMRNWDISSFWSEIVALDWYSWERKPHLGHTVLQSRSQDHFHRREVGDREAGQGECCCLNATDFYCFYWDLIDFLKWIVLHLLYAFRIISEDLKWRIFYNLLQLNGYLLQSKSAVFLMPTFWELVSLLPFKVIIHPFECGCSYIILNWSPEFCKNSSMISFRGRDIVWWIKDYF